jgi:hypothetical protein
MSDLINALAPTLGQEVLIKTEPEILDFTNPETKVKFLIITKGLQINIDIPKNRSQLPILLGQLLGYLNKSKFIIAWNIKNFISYALYHTKKPFSITKPLFDLKVLENYLGERQVCPSTFTDAKNRLGFIVKNSSWQHLKNIYSGIHIPLITEVVPELEVFGLVNTNLKSILHPFYEIEGQINGRMKCSKDFIRSYNPHTLSDEEKSCLTTPDYDNKVFIYLDFKHMEVSVLQWLSQDSVLGSILATGRDLYESIWERVTGIKCNEDLRKICKGFFLPLIFGQGTESLSKNIGISESTAIKLFKKTNESFKTAFEFVKNQQLDSGICADQFWRLRKFEDDYRPKIRNFKIQSPASTICLHKLVRLHKEILNFGKICFHVHDGYCIMAYNGQEDKLCKLAKETLESSEELYPGLILKVSVYQGRKLSELKLIGVV